PAFFADQCQSWRAGPLRAESALLHGQFDVLHEFWVRIEVQQRGEPAIKLPRLVPLPAAGQLPEILVLVRKRDAAAADPAVNAKNCTLQDQVVHAGKNGVTVADPVANVRDATRVGGAFLECDEVFLIREFGEQFRGDIVSVTDRVVVNHDGQAGGVRYGAEVRERLSRVG